MTNVSTVSYHSWKAIAIRNDVVEMFIVPEIGRIVSYRYINQPDTDPIWMNDQTGDGLYHHGWINYGGDKLWPAPQDDWPKHAVNDGWPPDITIDRGPYQAEIIENGIRLTSPVSADYGVYAMREITLGAGARVTIADTFSRPKDAIDPRYDIPISIWNVTQTRGDATIFLPVTANDKITDGYYLMQGQDNTGIIKKHGDMLVVDGNSPDGLKIGTVNDYGWMAAQYNDVVVFSEHFEYEPNGIYLDHDTNAQLYSSPVNFEIEILAGGHVLKPGDSTSRTIYWNLNKLEIKPDNGSHAIQLINRIMETKQN